jgi:hypothetical protein
MKISRFLCLICALILSTSAHADSVKNSEFVKLSEAQQHWYYYGTFMGIGHMVSFEDEQKAKCIWLWMTIEPEKKKELLLSTMKQYPDHTPTSIIIGLLQRDCGAIVPTKKKG